MAFTTYANWNAFLSDNNISNFTYVNDIRYDNDNAMTSYIEYDGSYDITDGILVWGMHPYSSEYGYSNTFFVFWFTPNDNNVLLDSAPNTIDNFSFYYYAWMDRVPSDGLIPTGDIYYKYPIDWNDQTLENGLYANLYTKWYLATQYTIYEGTDYYIPHGRFFYLDSLDGSPWEGEVNPSKTEMCINAYHYIALDTNGRIDACKLILDTDKSGEASSIPNGGSFSIGEYNFTKLYEDNNHSGVYYWEDIEHSKITWLYNNIYYLMDKPSDWGNLHNQSFTCYPYNSTENSRTISITGPTEIGLVGKWLAPSTATITGESQQENILHLKGFRFHEFNINVSKPEIIIGPKILVLDNTGYTLTSLGNDDYNLTVPASRWTGVLYECQHLHTATGTVSFCLNMGDEDCCPDEHQTMVVCKDCGKYKITAVQEVCYECCDNDTTIWNSYLNNWYDPTIISRTGIFPNFNVPIGNMQNRTYYINLLT